LATIKQPDNALTLLYYCVTFLFFKHTLLYNHEALKLMQNKYSFVNKQPTLIIKSNSRIKLF